MTGGVCAVLDYEVELMAEYVTEMSTRLALGTSRVPDSFRKFISQILTSTRLPRTTILLGLNYFAKRINTMNAYSSGNVNMSEGHVWRLMTVALLLGSKFLDDNTFQNRSWADVSGIPVRELNSLEREWMEAIGWGLYVNLDRSEDYTAWINSWRDWEAAKKRQQALANRERLAAAAAAAASPVEADFFYQRNTAYAAWYQQQVAEYERLSRMKRNEQALQQQQQQQQQQDYRAYEHAWSYHQSNDSWSNAPVTPPDSGYGTPEYMNSAASVAGGHNADWFGQQSRGAAGGGYPQYGGSNHQSTYFQTRNPVPKLPAYNVYGHNIWEQSAEHGRHGSYFGAAHPYGQPVMG